MKMFARLGGVFLNLFHAHPNKGQYNKKNKPSLLSLFLTFLKVGIIGFGGPAGQIATIHRIVVDEKEWLSEDEFINAFNYCIALPGPETHHLATYIGWLMYGTAGGVFAGLAIMIPSLMFVTLVSFIYILFKNLSFINGLFLGAKAGVVAIIIEAVIKMSKKTTKGVFFITMTLISFVAKFFCDVNFLIIIAFGLGMGFWHEKLGFGKFQSISILPDYLPKNFFFARFRIPFSFIQYTFKILLTWVPLFVVPVWLIVYEFGPESILTKQTLFYSKMAFMTIGGAYSVLVEISKMVVEDFKWLSLHEVTEILSLSEAVPGPLIMFNQILSFVTSFKFPELALGERYSPVLAFFMTTWVTYIPSFALIFIIAPYIEFLRHNKLISKILNTLTACVFGIVIEFSIWFINSILFEEKMHISYHIFHFSIPHLYSLSIVKLLIAVLAVFMVFKLKTSAIKTIVITTLIGGLYSLLPSFI